MTQPPEQSLIHVVAAAISDDQGRILITRRHDHLHQGGLWEFPGGKLEPNESPQQALQRELDEELGIQPAGIEPLICVTHHYPECTVKLDVYRVSRFNGIPYGREGQPLKWQLPHEMRTTDFPAADSPVITALQLPDCYLITGGDPQQPEQFIQRLQRSLEAGIRLVQLRAHDLDAQHYRQLATQALSCCRRYNARLLLNRDVDELDGCEADGVHLTSSQLMQQQQRPVDSGKLFGASCHNPVQLAQAQRLDADYVLLSPVLPTASHPDTMPLGWERFREWVAAVNLPVFALGGMGIGQLELAKLHGAQGIAAIRAFWDLS